MQPISENAQIWGLAEKKKTKFQIFNGFYQFLTYPIPIMPYWVRKRWFSIGLGIKPEKQRNEPNIFFFTMKLIRKIDDVYDFLSGDDKTKEILLLQQSIPFYLSFLWFTNKAFWMYTAYRHKILFVGVNVDLWGSIWQKWGLKNRIFLKSFLIFLHIYLNN